MEQLLSNINSVNKALSSNHYPLNIIPFVSISYHYSSSKKPQYNNITTTRQRNQFLALNDHPLIPGTPRLIPISPELLNSIKQIKSDKMILSTVKSKTNTFDFFQLYKLANMNYIPRIKSLSEINEIGCLCNISLKTPENVIKGHNTLLLHPLSLCRITQMLQLPNPIGNVRALVYKEKKLMKDELDPQTKVKYNYLKDLLIKTFNLFNNDDNCKGYLLSLKENYNLNCLNDLIYLTLASFTFPTLFMQYSFLRKTSDKIQSLLSIIDINKKLDAVISQLSSVYSELSTWESLVSQYNFQQNQTKTNEKVKSIYYNLKEMFEKNKDEKKIQIGIFMKNLKGKVIPPHIDKIITEEMDRYRVNDKYSMESNVIRNYLDILTSLPYGVSTEENLDIDKAKEVLNESHYGMDKVKERILESIAVGKLKGKIQGKILCFVGPPGVGKTSIGESIANALNRKYYRISLGGDRETSAIKGFRRTYVGAIPGKIVKALRTTGTENPVVLLDEIDKLSERNIQGDPSSVLLEVLDPEQNHNFTDDYLDTHIDLSKVLFICTANSVNNIPQPLYDRMDIIEVSGYTLNEKKFIYEKYLKPKAIAKAGLDKDSDSYTIDDDVIDSVINNYCRESGVRSLQRAITRIFEKIALQKVNEDKSIHITTNNLKNYLGPTSFSSMRMYEGSLPKGVSIGLGFNNYGGSVLYIESSSFDSSSSTPLPHGDTRPSMRSSYVVTGNVGKVMDESTKIAMTYAKRFLNELPTIIPMEGINRSYLDSNTIHIHFPSGAIPKDGPSAGVTICTSLLSLVLSKPIVSDLAMTGELTLTGKVLKIGGVKEKVMAAKREGMKTLIFPFDNRDDIDELEANVKEGIHFHFVKHYKDIFTLCFSDLILSQQIKH